MGLYFGGMKTYDLHPQLLLRVARFPLSFSFIPMSEVLQNEDFRTAIYLASDSVYQAMVKAGFEWERCSRTLQITLYKYYLRMCSRATPFGGFAGIGICEAEPFENPPILQCGNFIMKECDRGKLKIEETKYQVNPSLYPYGKGYRFMERKRGEDGSPVFTLWDIESEQLPAVLVQENVWRSRESLASIVEGDESQKGLVLEDLIAEQIILKVNRPDFTTGQMLSNRKGAGSRRYCQAIVQMEGGINSHYLSILEEGLSGLQRLSPIFASSSLALFRDRFVKLFDRQDVPLMEALDPEMGLDHIFLCQQSTASHQPPENMLLQQLLLRKWLGMKAGDVEIRLEEQDLAKFPSGKVKAAPSMMTLFSIVNDKVIIHEAGGVCGSSIAARFSVFDAHIEDLCQKLCAVEKARNPDVVFADIKYEVEEQNQPVCETKTLRDFEIPVFGDSALAEDFQLPLHDLYVCVTADGIVLKSKKLNKRVIPRLNNSYNYHRSPNGVFRFLCDLQYEGLSRGYSLSMEMLFPEQSFYPRVSYKQSILSLAKWRLDQEMLAELLSMGEAGFFSEFYRFAASIGLPRKFCLSAHDQKLVIDILEEEQVKLLFPYFKNNKTVVLMEWLFEEEQDVYVKDEAGRGYAHEVAAFLVNRSTVYQGLYNVNVTDIELVKRKFLPMQEWFYLKIYMHPDGMNELLTGRIKGFVADVFREGVADLWHFLRYQDTEAHLRLRVRCAAGKQSELSNAVNILVRDIYDMPNIHEVLFASYEREIERYAYAGMDFTELCFMKSSEIALEELCRQYHYNEETGSGEEELVLHSVSFLQDMMTRIGLEEAELKEICYERAATFMEYEERTKRLKIRADSIFRSIRKKFFDAIKIGRQVEGDQVIETFLAELLKKGDRAQLLTFALDIYHLHLNRLFSERHQEQEAFNYYFLYKYLKVPKKVRERGML